MGLLSKELLLQKEKLKKQKVKLQDGNFVYVTEMTAAGRESWEKSMLIEIKDDKGNVRDYTRTMDDFRGKLAVSTICDDKGTLLFEVGDAVQLANSLSATSMEAIIEVAQELNAITKKDKENIVKNSSGVQSASSNSD